MPARAALLALLSAAVLATASGARADIDRNRFLDASGRIELTLPADWAMSDRTSYPGILVFAVHEGAGRLTLAARQIDPSATARATCEASRQVLQKVGFHVVRLSTHPSGACVLEALTPDRRTKIRQGYRVQDGTAVVLTLAAPAAVMPSYTRAFGDALRSLGVRAALPPPVEDGAGVGPDAGVPDAEIR